MPDQIAGHLSQSITCIEVAEAAARQKPDSGEMRGCDVAVAMLQTEIHRPAGGEHVQILVGVYGWRFKGGEHVEHRPGLRILHQRQVDEILDRATSKLRPEPFELALWFLWGGMCCPVDAHLPQAFQAHRDCAVDV